MQKHYIDEPLVRNYLRHGNLPTCVFIKYLMDESGLNFVYPNKEISKINLSDLGIKRAFFDGFYFCYEV